MHRHLTSSASVETLKKEAKRWLAAIRGNDPAALLRLHAAYPECSNSPVCLRYIQHALALEYGAKSWKELGSRVTSVGNAKAAELPEHESLANDLLTAFESGNPGALQRISAHFARLFSWEDLRAWIWHRLYKVRQDKTMTLFDAQTLIAREAGFGGWGAFKRAAGSGEPLPPVPYTIDRPQKTISPSRHLDEGDWDRILSEAANQRLTTINANGRMTDAALKRLSQLNHVTTLRLGNSTQVSEDGLSQLANMPQLQTLELGGCVTDAALEALRHLPELKNFQLCWQTGVSDAGIANLAECSKLETVNLLGSTVGDGAIAALAGKAGLRRLMTGRRVTDTGLALLQSIPGFKTWCGGKPTYSLMSASAGPTHLTIDGPFTDAGVSALAGSNGLNGLYGLSLFWHCTSVTPAGLAPLKEMPHLGFLGIDGKLCNEEAMQHIAAMPHLKMLMAQGSVASDEGFRELSRSKTLEYLWGRECPNLTGRGFTALAHLRTLCGIAVSCKCVDDDALARLPAFPSLRELMPMDVSDDGFRHIGACRKLEKLWCMYCRSTTDGATEHLTGLSKLKSYYAGATRITDRSMQILGGLSTLREIALWECAGITDEGLRLIAGLPMLRKVELHGMAQVTEAGPTVFPGQVKVEYSI